MSENIRSIDGKRDSIVVGTIVELKTGGPLMVVEARVADKAYCYWHSNEGDLIAHLIPTVCLKVKT